MNAFIKTIWTHYEKHGRDLPWRHNTTPYRVVVSEIMLQQTQATRVVKKFDSFMKKFPNWKSLADAPLGEVLKEWQGLGYNRRALNLHKLSRKVVSNRMKLPGTHAELLELPGIGPNTAGSILAFAFNIPHSFIETNIRTVFIHFFFKKSHGKIHDKKLMPLIEEALKNKKNSANPREWYYALMDYGSHLKQHEINPSRKSAHHVKQAKFKGSNRELRSHILKEILTKPKDTESLVKRFPDKKPAMILKNISDLYKEGFIKKSGDTYAIL